MPKYTIRIQIDTEQSGDTISEILDAAKDMFHDATSICLESEDGTSETIYTGKEK